MAIITPETIYFFFSFVLFVSFSIAVESDSALSLKNLKIQGRATASPQNPSAQHTPLLSIIFRFDYVRMPRPKCVWIAMGKLAITKTSVRDLRMFSTRKKLCQKNVNSLFSLNSRCQLGVGIPKSFPFEYQERNSK